jgi:tripeptide aminopeptidase
MNPSAIVFQVADKLMRYVRVDTQSDASSSTQPSTFKQLDLAKILVEELRSYGIEQVELDDNGYVYARIPSNLPEGLKAPSICFCSHVDTAPDCSGTNVKPILHPKWDGSPIVLPDNPAVVISKEHQVYLKERIGDDIITASGTTLLGADDKAGVAIIMELAQQLMQHPDWLHGDVVVLFTPDEEIGRGVDAINMAKVNADFGYTLDGGPRGTLEGENFSADFVEITFKGISAHPGYAKGKMVNAIKVAAHFLSTLPSEDLSPETTEGRQGFVHPMGLKGQLEQASVSFILRDFDTAKLDEQAAKLETVAKQACHAFPGSEFTIIRKEQYRNMAEILRQHPEVMELARQAYQDAGLSVQELPIRGGTDGSRLSFMGLPCPNIFTGEMAIHSVQEYVSVQDMEAAVQVCLHLLKRAVK